MEEQTEDYKKKFAQADDVADIINVLYDELGTSFGADGCAAILEDEEKYLLVHRRAWKAFDALPPSIALETLAQQQTRHISRPQEDTAYNPEVDNPEQVEIGGGVWVPFKLKDGTNALLFAWKAMRKKIEQEQVPLLVGSEVVGVTTRAKKTYEANDFTSEEIEAVIQKEELFRAATEKIKTLLKQQRILESLRLQEEAKERRLQTIVTVLETLQNEIGRFAKDVERMHEAVTQTKQTEVATLQEFFNHALDIKDRIGRSLERFATEGSGVLIEDKREKIQTEVFFSNLLHSFLKEICAKELRFNYFIDPNLSKYIESSKYIIDVFVTALLRFCLEDTQRFSAFDVFVERAEENQLRLQIKYFKPDMNDSLLASYQNLFFMRKRYVPVKYTRTEEALIYFNRIFLQMGGKVDVDYDAYHKIGYTVTIPASFIGDATVVPHRRYQNVTVGMLFDKQRDFRAANNVARYFLSMGVLQGHIKAAQNIEALEKHRITHLVVFQSRYSHDLFKQKLPSGDWKVMIVNDGCPQHQDTTIYDFSYVDMAIEQTELYLEHLYIFLQE